MKAIDDNPYRQLGIFANSPTRERVANCNRLKAFLKVGKQVSFPLDLPQLLPTMVRTAKSVNEAEARLTLPKDQVGYAQFWFVKATQIDGIAFNKLFTGKIDEAMDVWSKKDNVSSLQNRTICSLIRKDYPTALACTEKLYSSSDSDIVSCLIGNNTLPQMGSLAFHFIDTLCNEVGINNVLPHTNNVVWQEHIRERAIQPLIAKIQDAIDAAKNTKNQGADARLKAGNKLMKGTKPILTQLRKLLTKTDLQYQMIVDKLGLEILQCSIDYYNGSKEADAATKSMKLQKYALQVVVGKMAKDRCQENVDILKKIIAELPPEEVISETTAIKEALTLATTGSGSISDIEKLLSNTKDPLQSMKDKLGVDNTCYMKMSTLVLRVALGMLISSVNKAQESAKMVILLTGDISSFKSLLAKAWRVTLRMDKMDIEKDFEGHYLKNRGILKNLCEQFNIPTTTRQTTTVPGSSGSGCMVLIFVSLMIMAGSVIISCRNISRNGTGEISYESVEIPNTMASGDEPVYLTDASHLPFEESPPKKVESQAKNYSRLKTGARPYANYYGKAATGNNYLDFKTRGDNDYVVIIKYYGADRVADHVYIQGGDNVRVWLPDARYSIYFYAGREWDSSKTIGAVKGGFAHGESLQKDEPVALYSMCGEYTLYPVHDGNLQLENASVAEAF